MSAIDFWRQRVAAHHAQSHQARTASGITIVDHWETASPFFKANPHRRDDVEVNRLAQEVEPAMTVLDVGGGAGRFALPLALRCRHVTVVEPSPSMRASLQQLAAEAGIGNITVVAQRWQDAQVEPADVALCAHVIYMIEEVQAFIVKLVEQARHRVLMPTFMRSPISRYSPFWRPVYGAERIDLPGAAELMPVLWEMGLYPNLEMFEPEPFRPLRDWQTALTTLRQRLYVVPETVEDARLQEAMRALLVETPEGYVVQGVPPGRLALISWQPA